MRVKSEDNHFRRHAEVLVDGWIEKSGKYTTVEVCGAGQLSNCGALGLENTGISLFLGSNCRSWPPLSRYPTRKFPHSVKNVVIPYFPNEKAR